MRRINPVGILAGCLLAIAIYAAIEQHNMRGWN